MDKNKVIKIMTTGKIKLRRSRKAMAKLISETKILKLITSINFKLKLLWWVGNVDTARVQQQAISMMISAVYLTFSDIGSFCRIHFNLFNAGYENSRMHKRKYEEISLMNEENNII